MTGAHIVHVFLSHLKCCDGTTVYAPQAVIHPRRYISRGAVKMLQYFQSSASFTIHDVLLVEHSRKRLDLTVRIFFNAMPLGKASLVRIAQFVRIMTGTAELN